jgi:hypothetical protein
MLTCPRMWLAALAACAAPPEAPDVAPAPEGPESGVLEVRFALEPGRITEDGWIGGADATGDRLVDPPAAPIGGGAWTARLPAGAGVARVARPCSEVRVPYVVTAAVPVVSLPYPACDDAPDALPVPGRRVLLDRDERGWTEVVTLTALGVLDGVPAPLPGAEAGPAAFVTLDDARAACAWRGGRLPTEEEWRAARVGADPRTAIGGELRARARGPLDAAARAQLGIGEHASASGHRSLDGNVEEWLADGRVAGGSFASLPDELGAARPMPAEARAETIGYRCAFDP